jgi:Ca-activated chloride channel family protein
VSRLRWWGRAGAWAAVFWAAGAWISAVAPAAVAQSATAQPDPTASSPAASTAPATAAPTTPVPAAAATTGPPTSPATVAPDDSPLAPLAAVAVDEPAAAPTPAAAIPAETVAIEEPFLVESTGWLLPADRQAALAKLPMAERQRAATALLAADPIPETPLNELAEGAARRRRLALSESLTPYDDRARVLFLLGPPTARATVDCSMVFQPLEVWTYGTRQLVLYHPATSRTWRLWSQTRGKGDLYTEQAREWLEDYVALRSRGAKRMDHRLCPVSRQVDEITGTDGLWPLDSGDPPTLITSLPPPADLAAWASAAGGAPAPAATAPLLVTMRGVELAGPRGSRVATRLLVELPPEAALVAAQTDKAPEVRLQVEGVVERSGEVLDEFRMRFPLPQPAAGEAVPVVVERALRAGRYTVRLRVTDEVGGAVGIVEQEVLVAAAPPPPPTQTAGPATGRLGAQLGHGAHAVALLVPPDDVMFGNLRVQAVALGPEVREVAFFVDGRLQLRAATRPFSVTLELPAVPREVILRAESRDASGAVLAYDEVAVNRPRGELAVKLDVTPLAGGDRVRAKVSVTFPEERRLEEVSLRANEGDVVILKPPAYTTELTLPADQLVFVTATAVLDDGARSEALEVVRDPYGGEALNVELVELLATLVDRNGAFVDAVTASELSVWEQGKRQDVQRVIPAGDLPLTVGVALDASGSMRTAMRQAQQSAVDFLEAVVGPRDRAYAVGFSARPQLLMPPTPDVGAVEAALGTLEAEGWTALYDGIVFSLYHLRAVRGRRALVVLSDGDDTKSQVDYDTALEHARASGVVIYAIGLDTPALDPSARGALKAFAEETGGRAYFVGEATDLAGTYAQIAEELKRQVLIAYAPTVTGAGAMQRGVEVKVERPGVRVRSVRGYAR